MSNMLICNDMRQQPCLVSSGCGCSSPMIDPGHCNYSTLQLLLKTDSSPTNVTIQKSQDPHFLLINLPVR